MCERVRTQELISESLSVDGERGKTFHVANFQSIIVGDQPENDGRRSLCFKAVNKIHLYHIIIIVTSVIT